MSERLPLAIPECRLDAAAFDTQIARYRRLAAHVTRIERTVGQVRVSLDDQVPDGLLEHTVAVERDCCSFLGIDHEPGSRTLTFTVASTARDSRLDSLFALLATPGPARGSPTFGSSATERDPGAR